MPKNRTINERDTFRALLRSDFCSFLWMCFNTTNPGKEFLPNWHLSAIAYELSRIEKHEITRLLINQPPRSLKSISVSVAFVAWLLGHNPTKRVIVASYSQELATPLHRQFRAIVNSEWYRQLFPLMRLDKDTETEAATTLGGGRYATSIGGSLTGRGADLIIVDDPHNSDEARSEIARARVIEWFKGTLLTRLNDKETGPIIVVAQRIHEEDLSGHLIESGRWHRLTLPAIAPSNLVIPIGPNETFAWRAGEALHPERESKATLDGILRDVGSLQFSAQYLQQPVPAGGLIVKRDWLQYYDLPLARIPGDRVIQSWDTATVIGEANDFSVCTTFMKRGKVVYLLDVFRKRIEYPDLRRKIRSHAVEYGASTILIEKAGIGLPLLQELRSDFGHGSIFPLGILPRGDKEDHLLQASARIESGQVFFPRNAPWLADFLNELLGFPHSRHDDQVDSLSQALLYIYESRRIQPPDGPSLPIYG